MVNDRRFKTSDSVRHQLGGQWMTILSIVGDEVTCGWLDSKLESQEKKFKAKELRFATDQPLFKFV